MNNKHYILKDKKVIETDLLTWANFVESPERIVKQETLGNGIRVSTVFLGIDYNFGEGEPLLFETMSFGGEDEEQERYATYEQAEAGHQRMVEKLST